MPALPDQQMRARYRIAAHIESGIRSGDLPVGAKLPSQRALAEQYGAARSTVQLALEDLASRGLVEPDQGRGVFVRARYEQMESLSAMLAADDILAISAVELLSSEVAQLDGEPLDSAYEIAGRFFSTVRATFAHVEYLDTYWQAPDQVVIEWSGGPDLETVLASGLPKIHEPTGEYAGGMAGLRIESRSADEASLAWLPVEGSRLTLRCRSVH